MVGSGPATVGSMQGKLPTVANIARCWCRKRGLYTQEVSPSSFLSEAVEQELDVVPIVFPT